MDLVYFDSMAAFTKSGHLNRLKSSGGFREGNVRSH